MLTPPVLNSNQALLELTLMNAESESVRFDDVVVEALARGVPPEIVTRLSDLWRTTQAVAGEIVAIGKIIVTKIIEFLQRYPHIPVGAAVGAAAGALVLAVPFLGPLLAPLTITTGTLVGAAVGATYAEGKPSSAPLEAVMALARKFFELLVLIFQAIARHLEEGAGREQL